MAIIGVDLGGTQLRIRLCHEHREILIEHRELVEDRSPLGVVAQLSGLVRAMLQEAGLQEAELSVSCAVAGMLDGTGQVIRNAPNLKWRDVPVVSMIQEALPEAKRVSLWNDLDAATWGEHIAGAGRDVDDVVAVFVGSGVGGGLVLGGRPYRGAWGVAGEIGHVKVVPDGRLCGCGGHGCVEAYAGGHSLTKLAREAVEQKRSPYLQRRSEEVGLEDLFPADIADGAAAHDPVCEQLMQRAGDYLGWAISHMVTLFNPARVILGGGVLLNWPQLQELVEQRVLHYISTPASEQLQIVTSELGDDAGMVGAVNLAVG